MTYLLTGFLSVHYRATENRWQTVEELLEATGRGERTVRNALRNLQASGRLEVYGKRPKRYRVDPTMIVRKCRYETKLEPVKRDVEQIRRDFCRKWNVQEPYQATLKNPDAMREWSEAMQ